MGTNERKIAPARALEQGSSDAERLLSTLNREGAVTPAEYNTLDQLNQKQLAELNLIYMPNGSIGRITLL